jgi:hypothetical protein
MKFKFDYTIKKSRDLKKLSEIYDGKELFFIKESGETLCLSDIMYNYDNQILTLQLQ